MSPCGRIFNSFKAAKEFDSSIVNGSVGTIATSAVSSYIDHVESPSPSVAALKKSAVEAIDPSLRPPVYMEVMNVVDDIDNNGCDIFVKENGLQLLSTAGTNYVTKPGDGSIDPRNTTSISYMLVTALQQNDKTGCIGTERKVVEYIQMVVDQANADHRYFKEVSPILRQFLLECSNMYKRELHTIQWYYTLFDALSRIFHIDIGLILPPDGNKDDLESRVVSFPFSEESCDDELPGIFFRLLIDRTKCNGRLGDGGCVVAGVSVFVFADSDQLSEVAFSADDNRSSCSGSSEGTNEQSSPGPTDLVPATKRLKSVGDIGTFDELGNGHSTQKAVSKAKCGASLFETVVNGKFGSGDKSQTAVESPPGEITTSSGSTARSLFTTPNHRASANASTNESETIRQLEAQIQMLKEKNNVSQSTAIQSISKGESKNNQIAESDQVGDATAGGDWGSLLSAGTENILKAASPIKRSKNNRVTVEVSYPIFNKKTGEQSSIITFMETGKDGWWIKPDLMTCVAETFFKHVHREDTIASCYFFSETTIKAIVFGDNKIARKTRRGGSTYPIYKMCCILNFSGKGFPVETHLINFEKKIKSMFSDSTVPAVIAVNAMKESSSNLYNGFFNGSYREGNKKGQIYKNDDELTMDIKAALEATFKNGFGSKTFNQPLNKLFTDWKIKNYLMEIGYSSFEDVLDCDRNSIYRGGNFPTWSAIEEDDING